MNSSTFDRFDTRKTLADDPILHLAKLSWEVMGIVNARHVAPPVRIFMSLNAASTAWHLHEWIWKRATPAGQEELLRIVNATGGWKEYVVGIQKSSGAIAICRQIATAAKHVTVHHDRDDIYFEVMHDDKQEDHATEITICYEGKRCSDVQVYRDALEDWSRIYAALEFDQSAFLSEKIDNAFGCQDQQRVER
jgi:hypothetical protein